MSMSAKAILARFQGDYREALEYARGIARAYHASGRGVLEICR